MRVGGFGIKGVRGFDECVDFGPCDRGKRFDGWRV